MAAEANVDVVQTGVGCEKRQFKWIIQNFDVIRKSDVFINSQKLRFQAGETLGLKTDWICDLFTTKKKEADTGEQTEKWIGIYLVANKPAVGIKELNAEFECKIQNVGKEGNYIKRRTGVKNFMERKRCWGWARAIRGDAELKDLPLINGSLVLEIQVTIYGESSVVSMPNDLSAVEKIFQPKFTENLQKDLANLLDTPTPSSSSDAETKILSKEKEQFVVHRGILSARSSVFERMLESDMKERRTGVIEISELGSKTIAVLLRFIYTGTLHKDWSNSEVITELVYAAEKYHIQDLLEFLDQAVGSVCRKENAGKLFNLAKKLGMKKAEQDLFQFMKLQMSNADDFNFFTNDISVNDTI